MRDRDYHKKQFVKHNSEYHWRIYQIFRNKVYIEIRKSKSRYYCQKIDECNKNDPKNTWKLINSLTGHSSMSKHINEIEVDDKTFRDDKNISEAFNEFFTNIGPKLASEVTNMTINSVETYLENNESIIPSFRFMPIPVENILKTLRQLNISKGAGLDKIPAKMLRIATDIIAPSINFDWCVCR